MDKAKFITIVAITVLLASIVTACQATLEKTEPTKPATPVTSIVSTQAASTMTPAPLPPASGGPDGAQIYTVHCASCHGADRNGGYGPPLNPTALGNVSDASIINIINNGGEGMPSFASKLTPPAIDALLQYIKYTP